MVTENHKIEAERLRLALTWGCEKPETVIAWADAIIAQEKNPDYCFIEISSTKPVNFKDLISLLDKIGQRTEHIDALRSILGRISYLTSNKEVNLKNVGDWLANSEHYNLTKDIADIITACDIETATTSQLTGLKKHLKLFETKNSSSPQWYSATFKGGAGRKRNTQKFMVKFYILFILTIVLISYFHVQPMTIKANIRVEYERKVRLLEKAHDLSAKGSYKKSISILKEIISQTAHNSRLHKLAHNNFAWLLATCPNPSFRNGKEAVKHAKCGDFTHWQDYDTLGAAYAETENFEKALRMISIAIARAPVSAHTRLNERKKLYSEHKPYRCQLRMGEKNETQATNNVR